MYLCFCLFRKMNNQNLTFWTNYQTAMQWINTNPTVETVIEQEQGQEQDLEFMIDDDMLDFYRLSKEHKINRSTVIVFGFEKDTIKRIDCFRKSKISREK